MGTHHDPDDRRRLFDAGSDQAATESQRTDPTPGRKARRPCVTLVKDTYPQTAAAYYWVQEVKITGDAVEGGPGTIDPVGAPFFALNTGTAIPPVGQPIDVTTGRYRPTFQWNG